jgi:hypothetical protein
MRKCPQRDDAGTIREKHQEAARRFTHIVQHESPEKGTSLPSEIQSLIARKEIKKRACRSNKVSKATWSVFGLLRAVHVKDAPRLSGAPASPG